MTEERVSIYTRFLMLTWHLLHFLLAVLFFFFTFLQMWLVRTLLSCILLIFLKSPHFFIIITSFFKKKKKQKKNLFIYSLSGAILVLTYFIYLFISYLVFKISFLKTFQCMPPLLSFVFPLFYFSLLQIPITTPLTCFKVSIPLLNF